MVEPPARKYKPSELPCVQSKHPDWWFGYPGSATNRRAKQLCMDCPLYWQCQEAAIEDGVPWGVWGGLDERDRARIWVEMGGRPVIFDAVIDDEIRPLLQRRRDEERDGLDSDWDALIA